MEVAAGHEQPASLEGYPVEQHGAPGSEMLAVGGHEVALMALEQQEGAQPVEGSVAAAEGKRKLDEMDGGSIEDPEAKRLRGKEAQQQAAVAAMAGGDAAVQAAMATGQALPGMEGLKGGALDPVMAAAVAAASAIPGAEQPQQVGGGGGVAMQLDPAAAAALGLTPEQQAQALMAQQFSMLTPEALAAAGATLPVMAAGGEQLQQLALDPATLSGMPILAPDGSHLTPEQLMQLFAANPMPFVIPFAPGQSLPPGMTLGPDGNPVYKNWWDEKDEKELVSLVEDPAYRQAKLGCEELDWDRIATHFGGRSQNALRKKYWTLTKKASAGNDSDPDALELTQVDPSKRPRADRKLWTDEETVELMRLATEPLFRAHRLHLDEAAADTEMWEAISMHFACSVQTAKRKFRHSQEALHNGTLGAEKAKRVHHRKNVPYRWMIVSALSELPNNQGTAPDIFERIEATPSFVNELDTRIMPGTKHVPRWKIQVRKVLSADKIFRHTGLKQKHETIWQLDQVELQEAQATSRNATRISQHQRAADGLPVYDVAAVAAADAAAAAGNTAGAPLSAEQVHAMHAAAGGNPQHMAMVQQEIAAVISQAPLALAPEQLQQMAGMGMPLGLVPGLHPQQLATMQAAAAHGGEAGGDGGGTALGEPAGGGGGDGVAAAAEGQQDAGHHQHQHHAVEGHPSQELQQVAQLAMGQLDPAMLAAMSGQMAQEHHAAAAADAHHAGFTLPMVQHTVEVPAPLEEHMGGEQ